MVRCLMTWLIPDRDRGGTMCPGVSLYPGLALTRKHPRFHRGLASLSRYRFIYSNEKAKRELGYSPKSLPETLNEIIPVLKQNSIL